MQKGSIAQILILLILLAGIFAAVSYIKIPQVFKSRASSGQIAFPAGATTASPTVQVQLTSPYGPPNFTRKVQGPTPVLYDDFHDPNNGWANLMDDYGYRIYEGGNYLMGVVKKETQTGSSKNIGMNQFSVVTTFKIGGSGEKLPGVVFGEGSRGAGICAPGEFRNQDCYRFFVSSMGYVKLNYRTWGDDSKTIDLGLKQDNYPLADNTLYYLRVDRSLNDLNSWISTDGNNWTRLPSFVLQPNLATPPYAGMLFGGDLKNDLHGEARFFSFAAYKYGDLPEPGSNGTPASPASETTASYRIAESPDGVQNAPWQDYTAHPLKISYTFSNPNPGIKVLYVQFKATDGQISPPVNASITLQGTETPTPTPGTPSPPTPSPGTSGNVDHPTATLSGPATGKVGQKLDYQTEVTTLAGISQIDLFVTKDLQTTNGRVDSSEVADFDPKFFNCDNVMASGCAWYSIGSLTITKNRNNSADKSRVTGSVVLLRPGKYLIAAAVVPAGEGGKNKACSMNPFTTYPVTAGGYTFYNCGGAAIYLTVTP